MRAAGEADAGRGEIFHAVLFDRPLKSREAGCGDTLSEGLGIRGLDDDDELISPETTDNHHVVCDSKTTQDILQARCERPQYVVTPLVAK